MYCIFDVRTIALKDESGKGKVKFTVTNAKGDNVMVKFTTGTRLGEWQKYDLSMVMNHNFEEGGMTAVVLFRVYASDGGIWRTDYQFACSVYMPGYSASNPIDLSG